MTSIRAAPCRMGSSLCPFMIEERWSASPHIQSFIISFLAVFLSFLFNGFFLEIFAAPLSLAPIFPLPLCLRSSFLSLKAKTRICYLSALLILASSSIQRLFWLRIFFAISRLIAIKECVCCNYSQRAFGAMTQAP